MKPPRRNSPSVNSSKPSSCLLREDAQDLAVLHLAQLLGVRAGVAQLEQLLRPQEAADVIGAIGRRAYHDASFSVAVAPTLQRKNGGD